MFEANRFDCQSAIASFTVVEFTISCTQCVQERDLPEAADFRREALAIA